MGKVLCLQRKDACLTQASPKAPGGLMPLSDLQSDVQGIHYVAGLRRRESNS